MQKCAFNAEETDIEWQNGSVIYGAAIAINPQFPVDNYALEGDSGSAVYRSLSSTSLRSGPSYVQSGRHYGGVRSRWS